MSNNYMQKMILLKYLKIYVDTDLKIILLDYQNNYIKDSNITINRVDRSWLSHGVGCQKDYNLIYVRKFSSLYYRMLI